jgi:phage/plasmid-like protein (TIGR03299 family)
VYAKFRGTGWASCSTSTQSRFDEALDKAGLGWKVTHGDVLVVRAPEWTDDVGAKHPAERVPARSFKANLRGDAGEVLGIVSDECEVVDNREFRFLDALIGSELPFETAGSLWGGRRVWVLARLPEYIELGGDQSATYVYVANSHDGSMAVTAAATPIRIPCANTLYPNVWVKRVIRTRALSGLAS